MPDFGFTPMYADDPYATPEEIASSRRLAEALLNGKNDQKVYHWTQGVSNMLNALRGSMMLDQARRTGRTVERSRRAAGLDEEDIPVPQQESSTEESDPYASTATGMSKKKEPILAPPEAEAAPVGSPERDYASDARAISTNPEEYVRNFAALRGATQSQQEPEPTADLGPGNAAGIGLVAAAPGAQTGTEVEIPWGDILTASEAQTAPQQAPNGIMQVAQAGNGPPTEEIYKRARKFYNRMVMGGVPIPQARLAQDQWIKRQIARFPTQQLIEGTGQIMTKYPDGRIAVSPNSVPGYLGTNKNLKYGYTRVENGRPVYVPFQDSQQAQSSPMETSQALGTPQASGTTQAPTLPSVQTSGQATSNVVRDLTGTSPSEPATGSPAGLPTQAANRLNPTPERMAEARKKWAPIVQEALNQPEPGPDIQLPRSASEELSLEARQKGAETAQSELAKHYIKYKEKVDTAADTARGLQHQLDLLEAIVKNPNAPLGTFAEIENWVNRAVTTAAKRGVPIPGVGPDELANMADKEVLISVFRKVVGSGVLQQVRSLLPGDRINQQELQFAYDSFANPNLSPEANLMVINELRKINDRTVTIADMGRAFIKGKKNGMLDSRFDEAVDRYMQLEDPTDYDTLRRLQEGGVGRQNEVPSSNTRWNIWDSLPNVGQFFGGGTIPTPTPNEGAINYLRANPGTAAEFDKKYGPGSSAKILGGQ